MAKLFYSILLVSIFGMVLGFEIDKNEPDCEVRRYYGQKFIFGTKTRTETDVESADICAWICYQYNAQGEKCASANYWDDFKECQMNSDTHLDVYDGVGNLYSRPGWVYVVPKSCNGKPMPETTEAPAPTPAPTQAPYPGNTGGSTGGSTGSVTDAVTNNIQPGSCGQSNVQNKVARGFLSRNSHHRIVGGLIANPHSMPWIVSLRLRLVDFHFCGGTLVRVSDKVEESDIIITAAHCMEGSSPNFDVVAGAHYQKTKQPGEQAVRAERFVIHHGYNVPLRSENNDIAIVKLSKPIKFSSTIQPACLPAQNETIGDGVNGIVAGWGNSREGGSSPDALNQVVVPTMSSEQCRRNPKYKDVIPQTMLCAGYDAGQKDACQGDSGGPFVFLGKNGYTLHGVVSWGIGCARAGNPGIYARVSNYADWIQQQIQRLTSIRV